MAQRLDTRTIHTITIDLEVFVLSRVASGDEIEIILVGRDGFKSSPKRLTYRDVDALTIGPTRPIGRN